jgi:Ca-activated chloride channel family protein
MSTPVTFTPSAAANGDALKLSMQRLWLTGQILPAGARLVVQHVFRSQEEKALEVIYAFPLPRDAALRRFRIVGDGFEAQSELRETVEAVEAYEAGVARGSLAALARQYGDGVVNLTVGNVRPNETVTVLLEVLCGVELRDDGFRFRFPFTLAPSYHACAKTAATEPGIGEIELPAVEFGDMILPAFHQDPSALHQVGFGLEIVSQLAADEIASPSHPLRVKQDGRSARIALGIERDVPDRDLVLDARYRSIEPVVLAGRDERNHAHFAAIIPSSSFGAPSSDRRRVVILLDRSGSMQGAPLSQARKAIAACLGALSATDSFGLVAFGSDAAGFWPELVPGTREWRDRAHQFLGGIQASGGTALSTGVAAAARLLGGEGGDILILTDGQVFGTEKILADARIAGIRLHCLGIGSASQDRFLALLARETGGVSRFVTSLERVDISAVDLFACVGRPVASDLKAGVNIEPQPAPFVFSGAPVLVFGEAAGSGEHQIELTWDGGRLTLPVRCHADNVAETIRLLQGSRLITDFEARYPAAEAQAPLEKRKQGRVSTRLLELSRAYGLVSREMSLVAVVTRRGDRPGELPETQVVPLGVPQGMALAQVFGAPPPMAAASARIGKPRVGSKRSAGEFTKIFSRGSETLSSMTPPPQPSDILMDLAAGAEPDGGMSGNNPEARALSSTLALLAFLSQGHTLTDGAFRSHVARLVAFLEKLTGLSRYRREMVDHVLELARKGNAPAGDWLNFASAQGSQWKAVEKLLLHPN